MFLGSYSITPDNTQMRKESGSYSEASYVQWKQRARTSKWASYHLGAWPVSWRNQCDTRMSGPWGDRSTYAKPLRPFSSFQTYLLGTVPCKGRHKMFIRNNIRVSVTENKQKKGRPRNQSVLVLTPWRWEGLLLKLREKKKKGVSNSFEDAICQCEQFFQNFTLNDRDNFIYLFS